MRKLAVLSFALLTACGSVPSRQFEIRCIDTDEQPVKCLVIVDRKWPLANHDPVYTDGSVAVTFPDDSVNIRVMPVQTGADGRIAKVPEPDDTAPFLTQERDLQATDPRVQLFILRRDPEYIGPAPR